MVIAEQPLTASPLGIPHSHPAGVTNSTPQSSEPLHPWVQEMTKEETSSQFILDDALKMIRVHLH